MKGYVFPTGFFLFAELIQNTTIEERVTLLEIQVVEIDEDVTGLDQDVNFLFEETIIQDERIFNLEQTSVAILGDLNVIQDDVQGLFLSLITSLLFL